MDRSEPHTLKYSLLISASFALALFCAAYPMYVIRPFRHQGARELAAALAVLRFRPGILAVCAVIALSAVILYWRTRPQWVRRIAAIAGVVGVGVCAAASRVNVYELMFHPLGPPSFDSAAQSKLDGKEMVIAVNFGGTARAYPIRSMSYHHVVNDVVNGVPIVATY